MRWDLMNKVRRVTNFSAFRDRKKRSGTQAPDPELQQEDDDAMDDVNPFDQRTQETLLRCEKRVQLWPAEPHQHQHIMTVVSGDQATGRSFHNVADGIDDSRHHDSLTLTKGATRSTSIR